MTTTNNFDQSSTGINIEFTAFYDLEASRRWFDDEFAILNHDGFSLLNNRFRGVDIYAYGLDIDLFDLGNWIIPTNKILLNQIRVDLYGSTEDLKSDCLDLFGKYPSKMNKSELVELVENQFSYDYHEFIVNNFEFKHGIVSSRGHCQGDYVEVVYNKTDFTKEPDFDNELWNAPIYARFMVNDMEFYIDENMVDRYEWNATEIKCIIAKLIKNSDLGSESEKDAIYKEVCAMIPSDLEYV